ncbi:helix-turn-helix transcriptional regulator [Streptomyces tanashiensis]|uniref:LuxR C-terminal-related transcriptional regulator n=1 Tax=Streptomyces tanashiensis TaxID=67367 RepID=A0ABY6R190_9ACTN|nr:LuxR family transcriptional regulator [Streptomyces tanashiensis]UZX23236.1 LuxR C-terminal-related transcriptional regulator [Streptomyces tanashiensis]
MAIPDMERAQNDRGTADAEPAPAEKAPEVTALAAIGAAGPPVPAPPSEGPESPDDPLTRVYTCLLARDPAHPPARPADLAAELDLPLARVESAVSALLDMGLLRRDQERAVLPVAPDEAVQRTLGPLEREMRARRQHMERTREQLMAFMPLYESHLLRLTHLRQAEYVELLTDLRAVREAITELGRTCEREVMTAQPGGGRRAEVLEEAVARDEELLRRGVRMRVLYQHTARFSSGTCAYVERVGRLGAQVRTLDDEFMRMLVFDRATAVIPVPDDPHAAVLIREPHVVAFMVGAYERLWLEALPFETEWDRQTIMDISDELKQTIVRLLTEGLTDAAIARRLGLSVRSCRRHVADVMAALGAESRFQAGYLLAQQDREQPAP